jgi:hypothetical protein
MMEMSDSHIPSFYILIVILNSVLAAGTGHEGHVHFAPDQVESHNMEIQVKNIDDRTIDIHLGFLKVHHHYELSFCVRDNLGEEVAADPLQNVHVTVQQMVPTEDGM